MKGDSGFTVGIGYCFRTGGGSVSERSVNFWVVVFWVVVPCILV